MIDNELLADIENIIYRRLAPLIGDTNTEVTDKAAKDVYEYLVETQNLATVTKRTKRKK